MKKLLITSFLAIASLVSNAESKKKDAVIVSTAVNCIIEKDKLLADPNLHLTDAYKDYKIKSYALTYVPKLGDKEHGPYYEQGSSFATEELAVLFTNLNSGDRLYFEDVILEAPNGKIIKVNAGAKIK